MKYVLKLVYVVGKKCVDVLCTCWLKMLLFANGVVFGSRVKSLNGMVSLHISLDAGNISIGNDVTFNNFNDAGWYSKCAIWVQKQGVLHIGNNSGFNGVLIHCRNYVSIGDYVNIGGGTRIFDSDFHPIDYLKRRLSTDGTVSKPVVIGNDVFIGTGCIIGKGVMIGDRSIVAAGSVVVKPIPSDEMWGGNPAMFIKKIVRDA